ncbi:hypothetical protein BDF21DRAFT_419156 [Thamnidium elegans]|nr:hypothetical protein BDF21DRAFT_419156 [Thamnidium elegans]
MRLNQEKTKAKPATHWLSSVLDTLIPINILYSLVFVGVIYFGIIMVNLRRDSYGRVLTNPFITLICHALLLSYAILLSTTISKFSYKCSFLVLFIVGFELYWILIVAPTLDYDKGIFSPTP